MMPKKRRRKLFDNMMESLIEAAKFARGEIKARMYVPVTTRDGREFMLSLKPDDNDSKYLVTSRDFPELSTFGVDEAEAVARGTAAIEEAIAAFAHAVIRG
jgi:predicted RNase H-like HicB family nuclease